MNAINDLFQTVAEFRKFVPGISANIEFSELNSSAISARKQIRSVITGELWDQIKDETDDARYYLCNAFGNLIMHKSLIFDIISREPQNPWTSTSRSMNRCVDNISITTTTQWIPSFRSSQRMKHIRLCGKRHVNINCSVNLKSKG